MCLYWKILLVPRQKLKIKTKNTLMLRLQSSPYEGQDINLRNVTTDLSILLHYHLLSHWIGEQHYQLRTIKMMPQMLELHTLN